MAKRLKPEVVNSKKAQAQMQQQKMQQKYYHDQGYKELPPLAKGDKAFMQVRGEWVPVTVTGKAGTPRSYVVKTAYGKEYRRNSRHLRKAHQQTSNSTSEAEDTDIWDDPVQVEPTHVTQPVPLDDPIPVVQAEQIQPEDQPPELGQPVTPGSPTANTNTDNNLPTSPEVEERPTPPEVEERPTPPPRTSRGRLVKKPLRYTDFVNS